MARERIPTILKIEGIQKKWPAFSLWNESYIKEKVATFPSVYEGHKKTFLYFDESKPMSSLSSIRWKTPFKVSDLDTETFFSKIERHTKLNENQNKRSTTHESGVKNPSYFYFSGNLERIPQLQTDIGDTDFLAYTQEGKVTNLWIGQSGVTAQAHYDSFHNFYVQISGEKRFLLIAPENVNIH